MNSTSRVIQFLRINEWKIGAKISKKAEEDGKKLLPVLKKKHKADINRHIALTRTILKFEKERDDLDNKLQAVGLDVSDYV